MYILPIDPIYTLYIKSLPYRSQTKQLFGYLFTAPCCCHDDTSNAWFASYPNGNHLNLDFIRPTLLVPLIALPCGMHMRVLYQLAFSMILITRASLIIIIFYTQSNHSLHTRTSPLMYQCYRLTCEVAEMRRHAHTRRCGATCWYNTTGIMSLE